MADQRVLVLTTHQRIRWSDMDMLGHVNNTVYFRYMEQARIEWTYGLHGALAGDAAALAVVVNASCNFRIPLVYPADVEIRMSIGDPGRTSIGSFYELLVDGRQHADGAARIVWTDRVIGRPVPLPPAVLAPLRAAAD
ncbi:MAG: thioesterase family protein [Betaproteobacteria bacterium]